MCQDGEGVALPYFDFRCENGHVHEAPIRANDPPPPCPDCGAETKKIPSRISFVLAGTGWSKDNYGLKKE